MPRSLDNSADSTTRLLRAQVRRVFSHLPKALTGEEEQLHQMRVAARRLRVALPLLARKPEGKRARRALRILRDVTRAGGGSRDLDVSVTLLEQSLDGVRSPEVQALRRRLKEARGRSHRRMAESLLDLDIARLRRCLRAVLSRRAEGLFTVLIRAREAAEAERTGFAEAFTELGERFEPRALHGIRIRARRLRYQAEVIDALRGHESGAAPMFKQLQETLGQLHDAFVLSEWLRGQAERAALRGAPALAEEARRLGALMLERSRDHHAAFQSLDPPGLIARAFAAMLPSRSAA
jgi:CHAD domain-containing protein